MDQDQNNQAQVPPTAAPQQAAAQQGVPGTQPQQPPAMSPGGYSQVPQAPQQPPAAGYQPTTPQTPAPEPAPQTTKPKATKTTKGTNPNSSQNSLQIAEIRDGIVIMKDGSYRAVVLAQSINFDLMSPQEREGVEQSFQGFLNSLYFSIQIMMRSRRVDLRGYMNKLNTTRANQDSVLLGLLMDDYIAYIEYLSQNANIMDKQFFVVIPYEPTDLKNLAKKANMFSQLFQRGTPQITINEQDFVKAKNEIKNRVQAVLENMNQMGVQAIPLNTQELIELYYDVYNPDTATSQPLVDHRMLEGSMVEKGRGEAVRTDLEGNN